ncbi:Putative FKBP-type peptidyl-prolyl cis-trans isomerase [uncultured archaeon]|nr:Putative FKBP-type peptidyl-prolyl cis-trans isomerase [uncultured archaeon]
MGLQKKDFVEIEFTGKIKGGEIFDSNIKEDLKKLNPEANPKPIVLSLGEGMFLKGIDDFLIGKEIGDYNIELTPEKAFGPRVKEFTQMIPIKVFKSQNIMPSPGDAFNFDGRIAKVLTVSGGRVIVDFNNPLAGKTVIYKIKVLRKVEDLNEKAKSFIDFLFRRELKFSIVDKKIILEVEKGMSKFVELFKDKFKDILGLDFEVKEITENSQKVAQ